MSDTSGMNTKEQAWKHRFVVAFIALMRGENIELAYGYANDCYGQEDEEITPEQSANGMYFALGDIEK